MNELEQKIMDIISSKPNGISSMEINAHFPEQRRGNVLNRLNSLWKYGFIDRTKTKIGVSVQQYYWRIHRVDNRIWTADLMALAVDETEIKNRKRIAELLEQNKLLEVWT